MVTYYVKRSVQSSINFIRWHHTTLVFYAWLKSCSAFTGALSGVSVARYHPMKSLELWMHLKDSKGPLLPPKKSMYQLPWVKNPHRHVIFIYLFFLGKKAMRVRKIFFYWIFRPLFFGGGGGTALWPKFWMFLTTKKIK